MTKMPCVASRNWLSSSLAFVACLLAVVLCSCTARQTVDKSPAPTLSPSDQHATPAVVATGREYTSSDILLESQKLYDPPGEWGRPCPGSVTLSPDGKMLAVVAEGVERLSDRAIRWLEVRDTATGRLLKDFGDADNTAARWHPSKRLLIAGNNDADKPTYFVADLSKPKRQGLMRGGIDPMCWGASGVFFEYGIAKIGKAGTGISGGNFGYPIPWDYPHTNVMRLSCGPDDRVAAELWALEPPGRRGPAQRIETYRKVPGRMQWLKTGRIDPKLDGKQVVWYPNNPNSLADGRLVYLRIYPKQWTHPRGLPGGGRDPVQDASTVRNRAEVWVCKRDGTDQRKIMTLWDLRPYFESPSADWFTIDRAGKTICYLSSYRIRVLRLKKPL